VERPLIRRRLFWGLVASLLLHAGIVWWFHQTHLPEFSSGPVERLVPRTIFNLKNITIPDRVLNGDDSQQQAPPKPQPHPELKPLDLPDEKPMAEVSEGRMTPGAPAAPAMVKPIANDRPVSESNEAQAIARVQDSAKMVMDQDLDSLKDSLLKDQPADAGAHALIKLPESNTGNSAQEDAQALSAASGALDRLLGHGLHAGDAPVKLPGGALFEFDSSDLRTEALDQLHKLGMLIQKNPNVTFTIEGYTDSFGDPAYNIQLSQARADAVRTWLIQNVDVDPAHIQAAGYGATRFLVTPQPVDMHSQASIDQEKALEQPNRRVEIRFKFPTAQ
jgi:outer membrane protein OmpA-like peptidoglycan-associated protein